MAWWGRESREEANARRCREFLQQVEDGLRQHAEDVLTFRYGRRHPHLISGLVVQHGELGHAFVVAVGGDPGSPVQGGVCPEPGPGVERYYSISLHPGIAWQEGEPTPAVSWDSMDATRAATAEEAVDRVLAWAFPDPGTRAPAVGSEERTRLETIARGRRQRFSEAQQRQSALLRGEGEFAESWRAVGLTSDLDPLQPGALGPLAAELTTLSRADLIEDLRRLRPDWVAWNFPSQDDGRLPLGEQVILATYEFATRIDKGRDRVPCLVAGSPERRRDGEAIRISLESLIPQNYRHRWDVARQLWDGRHAATGGPAWGLVGIPMTLLAAATQKRSQGIADFERRCAGGGSPGDRAALAILLQDEGRLIEALELFGVEIELKIEKLVAAEKLYPYSQPDTWSHATHVLLRRMAPWLLEGSYQALCAQKVRKKKQRFRIGALPNQTSQKKLSVMLVAPAGEGRVRLELEMTNVNSYVPAEYWERPIELDFLRYDLPEGLLPGEDLP